MRDVKGRRPWLAAFAAAILLIIAGVLYLNYMTDQMMALASPELVDILESKEDVIVVSEAPEAELENESQTEAGVTAQGTEASPRANAPENGGASEGPKAGGAAASGTSEPSGTAVQAGNAGAQDTAGQEAKAQEVKVDAEAATLAEKAKAYKLASSKLSAKEINALIQWSQGGFTQEEKESAKSLFYSRFTAEEQQWILGLFRKYGQ